MTARALGHPFMGMDTSVGISKSIRVPFKGLVKKLGVRWIARYGPRKDSKVRRFSAARDHWDMCTLSIEEAHFLRTELKLPILPVQWAPGGTLGNGTQHGKNMAAWARGMKISPCVHLWCDLEGNAAVTAGGKGCFDYVQEWSYQVVKAGYRAGLYLSRSLPVGKKDALTSDHLEKLTNVTSFWKAANAVPMPSKGFAIYQRRQKSVYLNCLDALNRRYQVTFKYDPDVTAISGYPSPILWA